MNALRAAAPAQAWKQLQAADEWVASAALMLMVLVPCAEILMRPWMGQGIENAPALVQHLGLVLTMFGALAAERQGQLATLGAGVRPRSASLAAAAKVFSCATAAGVCGMLAMSSWQLVVVEAEVRQVLAYGLPTWWVQATMPLGFALLGFRLGGRCGRSTWAKFIWGAGAVLAGAWLTRAFDGTASVLWPGLALLLAALLLGAPIFAILGGMALALFWQNGSPLASVALSHYQITVNPSLPALPLFTLAGLIFAHTGAAQRLGNVFICLFGRGVIGTVLAVAVLCSFFTAFTGGSGVTILALGGLLLPLLRKVGYPQDRGIGLVTSASALGVLLAPSVPLIMYAILARVPINTMFLAGLLPALVMIAFLLVFGGFLRPVTLQDEQVTTPSSNPGATAWETIWVAKWELLAPMVAVGSLASGLATPTESAALTALYAVLVQSLAHRELPLRLLVRCLGEAAHLIGGVLLILGMALALTNYLVDAGIPDAAIDTAQSLIPDKYVFLLALTCFLLLAGALMEIFAALVVLVPLLLPVAVSYGIDPVHFGVIFLAAMEMGFLCPPAGMNIYFSSAMFAKPVSEVAFATLPALLAIFLGTLAIAAFPFLSTGLSGLLMPT